MGMVGKLKHFEWMCKGVQPDDITVLACSHAGLVDEGMRLYPSMIRDYMILAKWNIAPAWLCWPSTGGREYGHGNTL